MARTRKASPDVPADPPADQPPPPAKAAWRKWLVHLLLPLAAGAGLIAGVVVLGERARDQLRQAGDHTIAFADVECDPPEGLTRQEFLEEAQYLANLPDRFNVLEPGVSARIAAALAAHPWVAEVKRVEQRPPGRVVVELAYRVPVLLVDGAGRTVDRDGVLLPRSARQEGLPVLHAHVRPPRDGPGRPWNDETVKGTAAAAGLLLPHLKALNLEGCAVEIDRGDLVLVAPKRRVVWGRPPGQERPDEARAEQKLQRLLDFSELSGQDLDLRPADGARRRDR